MINNYTLISNYRDNKQYRDSFIKLAGGVFGIDFEAWYHMGCWNDRYICHSLLYKDQIVANVSVNLTDLIIDGERIRAVQAGTVMAHPDHRGRGLINHLFEKVIEEYGVCSRFLYLFADKNVFDLYPRYGFKRIKESIFSYYPALSVTKEPLNQHRGVKKIDIDDPGDLALLKNFTHDRKPVSQRLGVFNDEHIVLFHCMNHLKKHIYYLEDEDLIIIFRYNGTTVKIFDIIGKSEISARELIVKYFNSRAEKVLINFTPEADWKEIESIINEDSELFINPPDYKICSGNGFVFPVTSQA
ncbi:MAG: GNAT family N-acetyltransferase [Firmicutes bacterium]|nr:GNAT family N-acetyltransferase [Bacillota bacterium]